MRYRFVVLTMVFVVACMMMAAPVFAQGDEVQQQADFGIMSLLPPVLAITLAFLTKQVILSLFLGVLAGAIMVNGSLFTGFLRALDNYMLNSLADPWHAGIIIFTLSIGGMVGVVTKMGGARAVAEYLAKLAKNSRGAQFVAWLLGVLVFFDDYGNTLIVGPTMRPLTDRMRISREKLSYIVDSTAAPVAGIALMSTWIGYEVSLIKDAFDKIGMSVNAYGVFLASIPYRFYEIFALLMVLMIALMMRDFGPMYRAEMRARKTGKVLAEQAKPMSAADLIAIELPENIKPRIMNAVIPVVSLIVLGFVGLWYNGGGTELPFTLQGVREAFGNADTSVALVWASITSSIIAIVLAIGQRILTLSEALDAWVDGVKSLVMTGIILTLAWALGSVTEDVKAADYLIKVISGNISPTIMPMLVFIISCVIAFATGTSWGTMAIVMPLALPLAHSVSAAIMLPTLSSVLAGAIFGDHCSPISDTTIMSSMAAAADHMDHVKTQIPYAVAVAVISVIAGYIPAGYGISPLISLPLGIVLIYAVLRVLGKEVPEVSVDS